MTLCEGNPPVHSDSHMELEVFIDGQSNYWSLKYYFNIQNLIDNLRGELFSSQTVYDCICVASDHLFGNHRRSMGFVPSQYKFWLPDYVYRVSVPIIRIKDHYLHNDYPSWLIYRNPQRDYGDSRFFSLNILYDLFMHSVQRTIKHDDVINWKRFPRYWPFVWGIRRPPVNSPHKGQWRGALMYSFICAITMYRCFSRSFEVILINRPCHLWKFPVFCTYSSRPSGSVK